MIIKTKQQNKILLVLLVILLATLTILKPMSTFSVNNSQQEVLEELNSNIVEQLDKIDFSKFNEIIAELNANNINIFSIDNIKNKVYTIISGKEVIDYSNFTSYIFSDIVRMVAKYLPLLSIIISIGVLSNLLQGVKSKFSENSTANLINLVCYLSSIILLVGIITNLSTNTSTSISSMVKQINALFPILLTMMVSIGANASVGSFQPIVAILTTYVADIFNYFILPLFLASFVFGIISNITDNIKLDKFSSFISSLFKWSVGLVFTIFFAVMTIQGISAGSFDSVSIRTTKYAIKSYVPVMGGYLSDGMDLILSSAVLIKNSIGLVGILLIGSTILSPIIEILICSLMLKLVSSILQPLGNARISNAMFSTSKSITMLSSAIIAIGFMYIISVGLIMTTANVVM